MYTARHATPARHARGEHLTVAGAALTALALVAYMISSVTGAAWTDTTSNDDNSWRTGQVILTDDANGVALFTATGLLPGDEVDNEITVTNQSSVPLTVRMYSAGFTQENSLGDWLNVTVGTTLGGGDVFTGTLSALAAVDSYATGVGELVLGTDTGVDDAQTYYIAVELDVDAPTTVQDSAAQLSFVWEGHTS